MHSYVENMAISKFKAWINCDLSYVEHMLRDFPILFSASVVRVKAGARILFKSKATSAGKDAPAETRASWMKIYFCYDDRTVSVWHNDTFFKKSDWFVWAEVPANCMQVAIGSLWSKNVCVLLCWGYTIIFLSIHIIIFLYKYLTCLFFDFTENAEECWFHSVTVQSMFPVSV